MVFISTNDEVILPLLERTKITQAQVVEMNVIPLNGIYAY